MKRRYPNTRARRLRVNTSIRDLVSESSLKSSDLIQPIFLIDGKNKKQKIKTMPDIERLSIDNSIKEIKKLRNFGIGAIALFPCIEKKLKSSNAAEAFNANGLVQRAIKEIKERVGDITIISDVALDPYTSHGQDGLLSKKGEILNDETIEVLSKQAISHAQAGADIVAPSDMMDGRIKKIRTELENNSFKNTIILSYAAKYSSNFYGPFRDAVGSQKNLGSSKKDTYQMDSRNTNEALKEVELDINEGADIVMVKPGLPYLDIVREIKNKFNIPIFIYQVSGEYSMIKAATKNGWLNEQEIVMEALACMKRSGANAIITYYAKNVLEWMR